MTMSITTLCLQTYPSVQSFGTSKRNVRIVCKDHSGPDYTFEADGHILRAASGRFERLLEGVDLATHDRKAKPTDAAKGTKDIKTKATKKGEKRRTDADSIVSSTRTSSTASVSASASTASAPAPPATPHTLILKDSAARIRLLLQFLNFPALLPHLPPSRSFSASELRTLLNLCEAYKLHGGWRTAVMGYIARVPRQLAMQAADYEAVLDLVRLMQASRSPDLARAFFRLDWDKDAVCLLHLHHLANPWDMPDSVVIDICAEVFRALVYVETERALGSDMSKIQVAFRGPQLVFTTDAGEVVFGDELPSPRFFRWQSDIVASPAT